MSSFGMMLREEGVELELPADLPDVISLLDREVPLFSHQGRGYQLASVSRARLGGRWDLLVKLTDLATSQALPAPVGRIELERLDNSKVRFKVPPRLEQEYPGVEEVDPQGEFYGSFIFHLLDAFQRHKLIDLPGTLPRL